MSSTGISVVGSRLEGSCRNIAERGAGASQHPDGRCLLLILVHVSSRALPRSGNKACHVGPYIARYAALTRGDDVVPLWLRMCEWR